MAVTNRVPSFSRPSSDGFDQTQTSFEYLGLLLLVLVFVLIPALLYLAQTGG